MKSAPTAPQLLSSKPLSVTKDSGLNFVHNLVRDQFHISTWLLIGASIQCLLLLLPVPDFYIRSLALLILGIKVADTALMALGLKRNTYMDGTMGRVTARYPFQQASDNALSDASTGNVAVLLLGFRSNHPLGILAPGAGTITNYFTSMLDDLEANAPSNGYLGSSSYLDAGHRTTSSAVMTNFYFRSAQDVHAFAHGPAHRAGWDWWNKFIKNHKYLAIMHEVYEAPAGAWENIYVGFEPMGFGATTHKVQDSEGKDRWTSPVVDANRGRLRTHRGRMGLSEGDDHSFGVA
ncbi:hypothetical protein W97_00743 [Coniosporium apollinis CBS 100218]|uniref:Monooxygenase n=1 Tax=Coniosporium apollinis (strain CBS 100218) TaxID=1168221 RepID=R7YI18_CONA1|nr:uncharacterized protein W97_00743 [Coniosporium apollinis CBS 100218]EON61528.1 hypothetical protein W97_00743 [Coniosporium apollinis CBS 100218]